MGLGGRSFPWVGICQLLAVVIVILFSQKAYTQDFRGSVFIQARLFPSEPLFLGQSQHKLSIAAKPEYFHELSNGDLFTFIPFIRLDTVDSDVDRNHFDIRDLSYIFVRDNLELRIGVRQEFWGVTETVNLVDIINQVDAVEGAGATEKLGQPMINFSISEDWGILDLYILPYFRETTFVGRKGRGRPGLLVDANQALFESDAKEWHTDFAVRYFNSIGNLDIGLSHFDGTDRAPLAALGTRSGETVLIPFYQQVNQTGIELSYIDGQWLWKFEGIRKSVIKNEKHVAFVGGFEYTFSGLMNTGIDLGVIGEWLWDDRGKEAALYDNDVTFGLRLGFNDVNNSQILFVMTQGVDTSAGFPAVEASTLLDDNWRLSLLYVGTLEQPANDLFLYLKDDDFFEVELSYNF